MRYLILGATEAHDDTGTAIPLGGPKVRALLTALALSPSRPVPVPALIDEVWADDPPQDAPAALQALVGRLRRAIGKQAVESGPAGYRLAAPPQAIDLYAFEERAAHGADQLAAGDPEAAAETLRAALALWRGPALADLPERHAAVRPEARRLTALRHRIEADLRRGAAEGLLPELMELLAAHPYDETLHAQVIRTLRAEGRRADALAAYDKARRTLADSLGTDPGPELAALHAELLRDEPVPAGLAGGNIRPRLTSFVGREPELALIRTDLAASRLVTLTGPGGTGKTRLAEQAAAASDAAAWLVELAPLDEPGAVPGAVVSALGLRETTLLAREGQPTHNDPTTRLVDDLSRRPDTLLVLDNCEHVIDAAARLAETLLTRCPRLRILATSREPLGVPGEAVRPVEPLPPLPAHRLFAERARTARPDFDPEADPGAVAEICRRLDGLPLAIELAAARLRLLTPRQIADRLDDRFRLLTGGSRTVLPRQQTLRAVVDWSWGLLDTSERDVLRRASVFAGGWDLAAAQAVCGATDDLAALVEKSLVIAVPLDDGSGMRYRMLETIHEYAAERAAETPDRLREAADAHTAYYGALVRRAEPLVRSHDQLPWIRRLETELDNIRSVLRRTTTPPTADEDTATGLALDMGWFWWLRNYRTEGADWAHDVAKLSPTPDDPSHPRYWPRLHLDLLRFFLLSDVDRDQGFADPAVQERLTEIRRAFETGGPQAARFPGLLWPFATFRTDPPGMVRESIDAVVANCRRHGDDWATAVSLMFRTHMAIDMPGGFEGVDDDLAELRDLGRRVGDRWMRAQVAGAAAEAAMTRGLPQLARPAYEEALQLSREVGAHQEAPFLTARVGELCYREGNLDAAEKALLEAATDAHRYRVADALPYIHSLLATIALDRGDIEAAVRLRTQALDFSTAGPQGQPPHFTALLDALDARVVAVESGPRAGLVRLADGLRTAAGAQCTELVLAHLAERAAQLLVALGEPALAVRILGAANAWRADIPRSVPEAAIERSIVDGARRTLSPGQYATESAAGAALTPPGIPPLLDAVTGA
ncbi:BTAD domain-containing putative transcriptional regulator [Streptomyces sp. NBC_00083]|uniref:BTAD domain-containing putative transcriptional regulator n=1 Tax=Streptomyces sp. NBC_00083 TaxID=2975647 RepID=UPI00224FE6FB|nr:BTAD domain-containing putative transcriptional regulator [Streptomyces sp. NBC_00083]MCX5387756.1 winged helix-turn-helix domain-containing protein [Streptomyces sp. NBC_00083]